MPSPQAWERECIRSQQRVNRRRAQEREPRLASWLLLARVLLVGVVVLAVAFALWTLIDSGAV